MSAIDQKSYELAVSWLKSLGILCAGNMTIDDAKLRCAAYASLIVGEFPSGAFTQRSLEAVARDCKFFPSYGELVGFLSSWWKENRPAQLAITGPGHESAMKARDWSWLAFWQKHQSEDFKNVKDCPRQPNIFPDTLENHRRAHIASLIRTYSPAAFARIQAGEA